MGYFIMNFKPKLLPEVLNMLELTRGRWPEVSEASGVNYKTVRNIAQGVSANPGVETVERLHVTLTAMTEPAQAHG